MPLLFWFCFPGTAQAGSRHLVPNSPPGGREAKIGPKMGPRSRVRLSLRPRRTQTVAPSWSHLGTTACRTVLQNLQSNRMQNRSKITLEISADLMGHMFYLWYMYISPADLKKGQVPTHWP
jgi:hypothetical protein